VIDDALMDGFIARLNLPWGMNPELKMSWIFVKKEWVCVVADFWEEVRGYPDANLLSDSSIVKIDS
jgi:hypothetical protein